MNTDKHGWRRRALGVQLVALGFFAGCNLVGAWGSAEANQIRVFDALADITHVADALRE